MTEDNGGGSVRLALVGELDLATAPTVEERLGQLREQQLSVVLDLSAVEFIDSTGIRLLFRAVKEGREGHRKLHVEPNLAPQVKRVLDLLHLEEFIVGDGHEPS